MRRHFIWLLPVVLFVACRRGPEGPAGPDYVPPNQQGYIRGIIIAQDTFNNRRARENYNHIYYNEAPCWTYAASGSLLLVFERYEAPYYLTSFSSVGLRVDTSTSPPRVLEARAYIYHTKKVANNLLIYRESFATNDSQDTLLIESLAFSPQLTQVSGRLRGIRRGVTPPDTVTFEFESVIPRQYE